MKEVSLFGYPWVIRSDTVPETQYRVENVKVFYQASPRANNGTPLFPTTQRVSLVSPNDSSAMIATRDSLGWGTYEFLLSGRLDMYDPEVVQACWVHPDNAATRVPGFVEPDSEVAAWGDQNRRERLMLGLFVDAKKPMIKRADGTEVQKYPDSRWPLGSYLHHRVTISQTPSRVVIVHAGWWIPNQEWKDYAWAAWDIPSTSIGVAKVGVWRKRPNMYPASASGPSRIVLAGFKFTPLGG